MDSDFVALEVSIQMLSDLPSSVDDEALGSLVRSLLEQLKASVDEKDRRVLPASYLTLKVQAVTERAEA